MELAVDLAGEDARLAGGELEALAAHQLEQHDELELAAALYLPGVGALGVVDADGDVADQLGVQARLHLAGGELRAALPGERRGVDADGYRQRRLVDGDHGQRARIVGVGDRLADRHVGEAAEGDDLPGAGLLGADALQRVGDEELGDVGPLDRAVGAAPGDPLAGADRAVADAAEREAAEVGRGVEIGDLGLERVPGIELGRGDALSDEVEEGGEVLALRAGLERRLPGPGVGVDDWELDLLLVGVEVEEQLVDLVDHLVDPGVRPVDLVDDEDQRQPGLERFAQHEAGLRQRALRGVDEEQGPVDHRQAALDLAAEVRVAGGVDDVELGLPVADGGVLGENGDALLALEVHRVHDPLGHVLAAAKGARLPEHGVDQRRLAVVDVGDDRQVPQVGSPLHEASERTGRAASPGCGGVWWVLIRLLRSFDRRVAVAP